MKVREATIGDIDRLVDMFELGKTESLTHNSDIESDRIKHFLFIKFNPNLKCFVAVSRDVVVGMMVCVISSPIFSSDIFASHHIFYVVPEKRGSKAAYLLMKAYEDWAINNSAAYISIGVDTGLFTDRTGSFYEKMGYRYIGGNYLKDR